MKLKETYSVTVSISDRNGCGGKHELPSSGKIRGIVELGLAELDNVSVTVSKKSDFNVGDRVEWVDNGFHEGVVTLVDYDRIVIDGKHNVSRIDLYHKGDCPFRPKDDKDARITELEEHLNKLLKFSVYTCNEGTSPITHWYWSTVKQAVECMNRSACPELHFEEEVSRDNVKEV